MSWVKELAKAMRDNEPEPENTEGFGGGEDGEDEDEEEYTPAKKGISGTSKNPHSPKAGQKKVDKYCPAENGETTGDDDDDASVDDPTSIDKKTGGGKVKFASGGGTKKSLSGEVSQETADAIDVSAILTDMAKGINSLANAGAEEIGTLTEGLAGVNKGLAMIGKALTFSINQNATILKGLQQDVAEMGARPARRQAALKVSEKSFAANEGDSGSDIPDRLTMQQKSLAAVKAGKINVTEAARLEAAYNRCETAVVKAILKKIDA